MKSWYYGNKIDMTKISNEELRETRKQMFAQMEQRLQERYLKEEDRIFFEIPSPLCLKGLHLTL